VVNDNYSSPLVASPTIVTKHWCPGKALLEAPKFIVTYGMARYWAGVAEASEARRSEAGPVAGGGAIA